MKHFVQIYLAVQIMLFSTAIPALYADGICDGAISEGKQKYNAGDYQKKQKSCSNLLNLGVAERTNIVIFSIG